MKLAKFTFFVVVMSAAFSVSAADLILEDTFEQGSIDIGPDEPYNQSGNAPVISTDVARAGRFSMKSVLKKDAVWPEINYRTELSVKRPEATYIGDELWYGFSIYLPEDFQFSDVWEIWAQWHDVPIDWEELRRKNPPLALSVKGGRYELYNIWDADRVEPVNQFEIDGGNWYDLGVPKIGEWTDWVFHIKWSYESDGILEVWQDGKLVVKKYGPNTYNDLRGPYFKLGIYKGWRDQSVADAVSERVVYHDELRIGGADASYADVAPGSLPPKAPRVLK
jgi:hypothetical protein